ncbi:MAG: dipeptidase, partial [Bacteroidetes bacterium 4572_117]
MIKKNFLYLLLSASIILLPMGKINACTNFLVTKGASTDGSTMITYAADSHVLYGELYHWPAADYPANSWLDIYEWDTGKYLGKIKQVAHTYNVVGNMNEFQVAIGETTYGGRSGLSDPEGIMDYGSLIYVTLQRAKTAREAIKIMTDLVAEYGYYSSGESFSIADPNEVWIMEMIGKGKENKGAVWVARKIPDGYISGHANQARIRQFPLDDPDNCLYAPDVISFAREKGYYTGKKDKHFSFTDAYAPLDFGALRF